MNKVSSTTTPSDLVSAIRSRLECILAQIADARAGSDFASIPVRLVVVSKAQPIQVVQAAISAGISLFGENYIEEAVQKITALKESGVEWHMIGHVQSRKADQVAAHFAMVHSLDGVKLASRLDRFCGELKRTLPVLLEFNVSGEASKFGLPAWDEARWPDLIGELEKILALPHLKVSGLMTMPPYFQEAEQARPYFKQLRRLQGFLKERLPQSEWAELSMGTSGDFPIAVQEGATIVRIGEAILGTRPPKREK